MYMSDAEIIGKFRRADNKHEILQVLADLNGCSKDNMKLYLLEHGVSESEFPKRRRRPKLAKEEVKKTVTEEIPHMESVKTIAQLMEMPELTLEEQKRVDRALAIPEPVRRLVTDRVEILTAKIMELEKERDCLCDYLNGMVHSEAG